MDNEFVFHEPTRALGWTPEARKKEYERQYEEWLQSKRTAENEAAFSSLE